MTPNDYKSQKSVLLNLDIVMEYHNLPLVF